MQQKISSKWSKREVGCRRIDFNFLHATLVYNDGNFTAHKEDDFKCVIYNDKRCVVKHTLDKTMAVPKFSFLCGIPL